MGGGSAPVFQPTPIPVDTSEADAAAKKLRLAEKQRKGRQATILASANAEESDALGKIKRPEAEDGSQGVVGVQGANKLG